MEVGQVFSVNMSAQSGQALPESGRSINIITRSVSANDMFVQFNARKKERKERKPFTRH